MRPRLRRRLPETVAVIAALAAVPTPGLAQERLAASDLVYLGAFAYPPGSGEEWTYSGQALAYFPSGDPSGPPDGHPGSLFADGHDWDDLVGEISIPQPVVTSDFGSLPQAQVLTPLGDITGGWISGCNHAGTCPDCEFRQVAGLEYLGNLDRVAWNLRDWYNVGGCDLDSLGWSRRDLGGAEGIWHIGPRPSAGDEYHNGKTCNYLFTAPEPYAAQHLGGRWLIAGNHRQAGAFGGSQGPTLFATAPWLDGSPPAAGANLGATALVYYPEVVECAGGNQHHLCHYPGYRVDDSWGGGAWVEAEGSTAVLIFGRKGLGENCYGIPGDTCPPSACSDSYGWHSPPYEPQILFYDPAEVAQAAAGARNPWDVLPYDIFRPTSAVFNLDCPRLDAVAYDRERRLVYVTEAQAGPWGETAVHVWRVEPGLFRDGFESGTTAAWSVTSP